MWVCFFSKKLCTVFTCFFYEIRFTIPRWDLPLCCGGCCRLWLLLLTGGGAGGRLASLLWWWWLLLLSLSLLEFWLLTSAEDTPIPVPALRPTLAQPWHRHIMYNMHQHFIRQNSLQPHINSVVVSDDILCSQYQLLSSVSSFSKTRMRHSLPFVSKSFERLQRHFIGHNDREYKLRTDQASHIFHNLTWGGGAHKLERLNIDVATSSELD